MTIPRIRLATLLSCLEAAKSKDKKLHNTVITYSNCKKNQPHITRYINNMVCISKCCCVVSLLQIMYVQYHLSMLSNLNQAQHQALATFLNISKRCVHVWLSTTAFMQQSSCMAYIELPHKCIIFGSKVVYFPKPGMCPQWLAVVRTSHHSDKISLLKQK